MSRFVSAGTHVEPVEGDVQWLQAQQELEAARRVKQEQSRASDGKTLFEVLQANKGNALRPRGFTNSTAVNMVDFTL